MRQLDLFGLDTEPQPIEMEQPVEVVVAPPAENSLVFSDNNIGVKVKLKPGSKEAFTADVQPVVKEASSPLPVFRGQEVMPAAKANVVVEENPVDSPSKEFVNLEFPFFVEEPREMLRPTMDRAMEAEAKETVTTFRESQSVEKEQAPAVIAFNELEKEEKTVEGQELAAAIENQPVQLTILPEEEINSSLTEQSNEPTVVAIPDEKPDTTVPVFVTPEVKQEVASEPVKVEDRPITAYRFLLQKPTIITIEEDDEEELEVDEPVAVETTVEEATVVEEFENSIESETIEVEYEEEIESEALAENEESGELEYEEAAESEEELEESASDVEMGAETEEVAEEEVVEEYNEELVSVVEATTKIAESEEVVEEETEEEELEYEESEEGEEAYEEELESDIAVIAEVEESEEVVAEEEIEEEELEHGEFEEGEETYDEELVSDVAASIEIEESEEIVEEETEEEELEYEEFAEGEEAHDEELVSDVAASAEIEESEDVAVEEETEEEELEYEGAEESEGVHDDELVSDVAASGEIEESEEVVEEEIEEEELEYEESTEGEEAHDEEFVEEETEEEEPEYEESEEDEEAYDEELVSDVAASAEMEESEEVTEKDETEELESEESEEDEEEYEIWEELVEVSAKTGESEDVIEEDELDIDEYEEVAEEEEYEDELEEEAIVAEHTDIIEGNTANVFEEDNVVHEADGVNYEEADDEEEREVEAIDEVLLALAEVANSSDFSLEEMAAVAKEIVAGAAKLQPVVEYTEPTEKELPVYAEQSLFDNTEDDLEEDVYITTAEEESLAIRASGDKIGKRELPGKQKRGRKSLREIDAEIELLQVPDDDVLFEKQYYPISVVAGWFNVNPSLLRFWENEFTILKPRKNRKGDRLFRPEDVKNLQVIYYLLRQRKFTIEGAKEYLKTNRKKADTNTQLVQSLTKVRNFLLEFKASLLS